jgi:hypothetical protein
MIIYFDLSNYGKYGKNGKYGKYGKQINLNQIVSFLKTIQKYYNNKINKKQGMGTKIYCI